MEGSLFCFVLGSVSHKPLSCEIIWVFTANTCKGQGSWDHTLVSSISSLLFIYAYVFTPRQEAVITDLMPFTCYTFEIKAVNSAGSGPGPEYATEICTEEGGEKMMNLWTKFTSVVMILRLHLNWSSFDRNAEDSAP